MAADRCLSSIGRAKTEALHFSDQIEYLSRQLQLVSEHKQICLFEDNFPLNHYIDLTPTLKRLQVGGSYIYLNELSALQHSLQSIYDIVSFFRNREDQTQFPELTRLSEPVETNRDILRAIDRLLDSTGEMRDTASPALMEIRSAIRSKRASLMRIMQNLLKAAIRDGLVEEDTSLAVRDGRAVIPVKSSMKRKIEGYVHDESATGKTAYIEPAESFETNNEISRLVQEEQLEITRILREFTDWLRPFIPELFVAYDFLGDIDCVRGRALLAIDIDAHKPFLRPEPMLLLQQARHPLLYLSFKKDKRTLVPMNLQLDSRQRILLISGPNAGGKSVCLKSTGLLVYMLQCGFLVPAHEASEMGIFRSIFIDIGDEQSLDNDLSTYSSHLTNMRHFLNFADKHSLILIDEFGTGTEPQLGGAIAESVLEQLNRQQVMGVITTHYTNLKHFASATEGLVNGAMLFDSEQIRPLYRLSIGHAGSSFAFEIARTMGIPARVLQSAEEKVGKEHVDFDKNLKDLDAEKQYVERKRKELAEKEAHLVSNLDKYDSKLEGINLKRKEILDAAHKEADRLVAEANRQIEKTIKEIVESKAERERTRTARMQLELFRIESQQKQLEEDVQIAKKMEQLRQKQENRKNKQLQKAEEQSANGQPSVAPRPVTAPKPVAEIIPEGPVQIGDSVRIEGQSVAGEVLEISGKSAVVSFGLLRTKVALDRLERISRAELKRQDKQMRAPSKSMGDFGEKRLTFKHEIDIRGMRAEEAMAQVRDFVEQAIVLGVSDIQILHGKGSGILRSQIRDFLKIEPMVTRFEDAHADRGGAGITVIHIG